MRFVVLMRGGVIEDIIFMIIMMREYDKVELICMIILLEIVVDFINKVCFNILNENNGYVFESILFDFILDV